MSKILVLNSGSSSLKFQLFATVDLSVLASGMIEQIGAPQSVSTLNFLAPTGSKDEIARNSPVADHRSGIDIMSEMLQECGILKDIDELTGIGHRVVHGGEKFKQPVRINGEVIAAIEKLIPLAPLHNPANLTGISVVMEHAPHVPQVAVFDTAFHQTIPESAFLYALPYDLYLKQKLRRYGFHGTSHSYVARQAAHFLGRPASELNMITLHLGNGASAAAIRKGKCIDTSMGLTPLEGLIMGTRCGDLDPAIVMYLARESGLDMDALDTLLNKESGLKGICGENDMRTVAQSAQQGSRQAKLALTMFSYRIKKYIGAYVAALGKVDCIVFTGGIGENSAVVRQMCCENLEGLNIKIDPAKNEISGSNQSEIHSTDSGVHLLVIPTDEENEIAKQTLRVIGMA